MATFIEVVEYPGFPEQGSFITDFVLSVLEVLGYIDAQPDFFSSNVHTI